MPVFENLQPAAQVLELGIKSERAAVQTRDDNELGMMEAVVTKMSRIIAHVGIGEKGKHVVQQLQVLSPTHPQHCLSGRLHFIGFSRGIEE